MFPRRNEKYLIVRFHHRRPLRDNRVATAPKDGCDAGVDAGHVLANFLKLSPDDGPAIDRFNGNQSNAPVSKIQYLQRARVGDELLDIFGHQLFRPDDDIDGNGA